MGWIETPSTTFAGDALNDGCAAGYGDPVPCWSESPVYLLKEGSTTLIAGRINSVFVVPNGEVTVPPFPVDGLANDAPGVASCAITSAANPTAQVFRKGQTYTSSVTWIGDADHIGVKLRAAPLNPYAGSNYSDFQEIAGWDNTSWWDSVMPIHTKSFSWTVNATGWYAVQFVGFDPDGVPCDDESPGGSAVSYPPITQCFGANDDTDCSSSSLTGSYDGRLAACQYDAPSFDLDPGTWLPALIGTGKCLVEWAFVPLHLEQSGDQVQAQLKSSALGGVIAPFTATVGVVNTMFAGEGSCVGLETDFVVRGVSYGDSHMISACEGTPLHSWAAGAKALLTPMVYIGAAWGMMRMVLGAFGMYQGGSSSEPEQLSLF